MTPPPEPLERVPVLIRKHHGAEKRLAAVRPWLSALRDDAALPASVFGPVLFFALRRLALVCRFVAMTTSSGFERKRRIIIHGDGGAGNRTMVRGIRVLPARLHGIEASGTIARREGP